MVFFLNSWRFSKYSSISRSSCVNNVSRTIFRPHMSIAVLKYFSSFLHGVSKSLSSSSWGPGLRFKKSRSQMFPSSNSAKSGKQAPRMSDTPVSCWWMCFRSLTEKRPAQLAWESPPMPTSALRFCRCNVRLWQVTANLHSMTFHWTMKPSLNVSVSSNILHLTATQPSRLSSRSHSILFIFSKCYTSASEKQLCLQRPPFVWRKMPSWAEETSQLPERPKNLTVAQMDEWTI